MRASVNEASIDASLELMKVALEENEAKADSMINDLTVSFNELCLDAEVNVRNELKERLKSKSLCFKSYAWREKEIKLNKLCNKDTTSVKDSDDSLSGKKDKEKLG